MIDILVDAAAALLLPWLMLGAIAKVKAKWAGRKGAPVLQPLYDALKELRKSQVMGRTATMLFALAPVVSLVAVVFAALLVPGPTGRAIVSFPGDFVLFAYLLALARFLSVVAALDTGSSFEGMGASREAFFSALVEPGLFLVLASTLLASGTTTLSRIALGIHSGTAVADVMLLLAALGLFLMVLVEGHRLPVDDPATHLELTMVHEVMVLDNSGPDLAMIGYASALRIYLFSSIAAALAVPPDVPPLVHAGGVVLVLFVFSIAVGLLESWSARIRLTHVPQLLFVVNICGMLLFFLALLGGGQG